jgi:predicted N-formylglutamate amidohydrolase
MLGAVDRSILAVMQDAQPTSAPSTLLGPDDPAPFSVFHREGRAELVMFCDHAGRAFPKTLVKLGLGALEHDQQIAGDIGI